MANATTAAPLGAPTPALDLSAYTRVLIVRTGEIGAHEYRRGRTYMADAPTLKALADAGLIAGPAPASTGV